MLQHHKSTTPAPLTPLGEMGSAVESFDNISVAPTLQNLPSIDSTRGSLESVRDSWPEEKNDEELAVLEPPWDGLSQLIDGLTYFKIGEYVYVRRWHAAAKVYSVWLPGQVVRPDFCKDPEGREERQYLVSYWDLMTGTQKERTYSPSLKEIREIPANVGMPTIAVPAACGIISANANMQTSKIVRGDSPVFALLQVTNGSEFYSVWTPSVCLARVDEAHGPGYRVRVIAGPFKNHEFFKVLELMPHDAETAKALRDSGYIVEKSDFNVEY